MKKILSIFTMLFLLVSCCLIAAFPTSAVDVNYDDFDISDGMIIEYIGEGGDVVIPSVDADGNKITAIDKRAFFGNDTVTAVYICEGIEEIGDECFEGCIQLTEVSLPYSLKKLGYSPFRRTSVSSLVIPGNVKVINNTLVTCVGVNEGGLGFSFTDLVISPGVEEIKATALYFSGEEIIFPSSVYKISGVAMVYLKKDISIYICNPNCEVGTLDKETQAYKPNTMEEYTYKGKAPIALVWESKATVKIYSSMSSPIQQEVNSWKSEFGGSFAFIGLTDEKLAEKNAECESKGTVKPTKWVMNSDGSISGGDATGGENNNNNTSNVNNGDSANNNANTNKGNNQQISGGTDNQLLLIVIIGCATILIIVVIIAVVLIVISKGKKKKKKKNKKAAAKLEAEEKEPIIETENLEENTETAEKSEETSEEKAADETDADESTPEDGENN